MAFGVQSRGGRGDTARGWVVSRWCRMFRSFYEEAVAFTDLQ